MTDLASFAVHSHYEDAAEGKPGAGRIAVGWKPATIAEVAAVVMADLKKCDPQQIAYLRYSVAPYFAPIVRYGIADIVVVVAQKSPEVDDWEDVEGGLNVSPIGPGGGVLEHSCIQNDLGVALNRLVQSRERGTANRGPTKSLKS